VHSDSPFNKMLPQKSVAFLFSAPWMHCTRQLRVTPLRAHILTHSSNLKRLVSLACSLGFSTSQGMSMSAHTSATCAARVAKSVQNRTDSFSFGLRSFRPYLSVPARPLTLRGPRGRPRARENVERGGDASTAAKMPLPICDMSASNFVWSAMSCSWPFTKST
jgi:hypothetical protein